MGSETEIQEWLDKQKISEIISIRYARALDWMDENGLKDCFHEDALVDFGFFRGNAHEWVGIVVPQERQLIRRWHFVANIIIKIEGNRAEAESYSYSVATSIEDETEIDRHYGGRYFDTLEQRNGTWKILKRDFVLDWMQTMPSGAGNLGPIFRDLPLSTGFDTSHQRYRSLQETD